LYKALQLGRGTPDRLICQDLGATRNARGIAA